MIHSRSDYDRIQDPEGLIPDDEPVCLLRGQDSLAPDVLEVWATFNKSRGGRPELSESMRAQAQLMRDWQQKHGAHPADIPSNVVLPKLPVQEEKNTL